MLTLPVAVADQYLVDGPSLTVPAAGVLANDSDADSDPLTAELVDQPTNGSLTLNADGSFTYTPNPGFGGIDTFTYRAVTVNPTQTYLVDQAQSSLRGDATLTVPVFGSRTSNDTSSLIGDLAVRVSPAQSPFGETHVTEVDVTLNDGLTFNFDYGFFVGRITATAPPANNTDPELAPFRLQMVTPGAPAAVSGGAFNQLANTMRFDGIADVTTTGVFASLVENGPQELSIDEVLLDLAGTLSQSGSTVTVTLPISFADTFEFDGGSIDIEVNGSVVAHAPVATPEESNLVTVTLDVQAPPGEIGRHLFYNNSAFDKPSDSDAIDPGVMPLLPGETATGANISNYARGINGVIVDLPAAGSPQQITAADFEFRHGTTNDTTLFSPAAPPASVIVAPNGGADGTDRVTITWDDGAITNTWLEVTVLASSRTGLSTPDVFYFGNLRGDVTRDGQVDATDFSSVRSNPANFLNRATIGTSQDLNHDSLVNASDMLIVRDHVTGASGGLPMISPEDGAAFGKATFDELLSVNEDSPTMRSPAQSIAIGAAVAEVSSDRDDHDARLATVVIRESGDDPTANAVREKLKRLDDLFAELVGES